VLFVPVTFTSPLSPVRYTWIEPVFARAENSTKPFLPTKAAWAGDGVAARATLAVSTDRAKTETR